MGFISKILPETRIFFPIDELLSHFLTFTFLGISIAELLGHDPFWWMISHQGHDFIAEVIFLNSVHVIFTFAALSSLPELKRWTAFQGGGKERGFWLKVLALFAFFVIVCYTLEFNRDEDQHALLRLDWWGWPFIFLRTSHLILQFKGLSLLYNRKIKTEVHFSEENKREISQLEAIEKWGFYVLNIAFCVYWIPRMPIGNMQIRFAIGNIMSVACVISVAVILINSARFPGDRNAGKTIFLSRLLLIPCVIFGSRFAFFALSAVHGIEYLSVIRNMYAKSLASQPEPIRRQAYGRLWAAGWLYAGLYVVVLVDAGGMNIVLAPFKAGFIYSHFIIDRYLFRMRVPETRQAVAPLLEVPSGDKAKEDAFEALAI